MAMQCRCCLSTKSTEFVDMLTASVDDLDFYHVFNVCTQLEAKAGDELPGVLCSNCCDDMQVAYNFVLAARQGDTILRENLRRGLMDAKLVELGTEEAVKIEHLEAASSNENEEFMVEELLEEDDEEESLTQLDIMEVETVEEASSEVSYSFVSATTHSDLHIKPVPNLAAGRFTEDEADDEYLIEYNPTSDAEHFTKWKCSRCKQVLRGDVSFEGHMNMHRNLRPHKCRHCQCAFRCKNALTRHTEMRHNVEGADKPNNSNECPEQFAQPFKLTENQQQQHGAPIRCTKCTKVLDSATDLVDHDELVHAITPAIQCHHCPDMPTLTRLKIVDHYRQVHPEEHRKYFPTVGTWQCDICKLYWHSEGSLRIHRSTHQTVSPHVCQLCDKRFQTEAFLRKHTRSMHPEEYEKLLSTSGDTEVQCDLCKKHLLQRNLEKHMAMHEKKERPAPDAAIDMLTAAADVVAQCEVCKKHLLKRNLEKHMSLHAKRNEVTDSEVQQKFLCAYCSQAFKCVKYLVLHEKSVHQRRESEPQFECSICHKKCYQKRHLRAHMQRVHESERCLACDVCGNSFKTTSQLWTHKQLHEEKRHKCNCCDKRYARQVDLKIHMRVHTGEQPFACHLCEKRFPVRGQLTYHLQRHSGITHVCPHCGAQYDNRSSLKEHLFKHTGVPYRCELCPSVGFTRRLRFANHMQRVHNQTLSEDELAEVFAKYTGKAVRFKVVGANADDEAKAAVKIKESNEEQLLDF